MKRIFTFLALAVFVNMSVFAQMTRTNPKAMKVAVPIVDMPATGNEVLSLPKGSYLKNVASDPSYGDTVGYTWYDYQTNGSMQHRIHQDDAGNIQVVWTKAVDTIRDPANSLRGIGYNYYDASSMTWNPGDSNNTSYGLAEKRVGWPSIAPVSGNQEVIFAHTDRLYKNTGKGTSDWANGVVNVSGGLHNASGVTFYHTTAEGNSIYSTYSNGAAIGFGRSDDGGSTWPINNFAVDSVCGNPLRLAIGDAVDMDVKGDTIAMVIGGSVAFSNSDPNDVVLYVSDDRGLNWTCTVVHKFDTINAVLDSASGGYQVESPHSDVNILIGNDGKIHLTGSVTAVLTDAGALTSGSWYPLVRGIWYWNSDMPAGFDINDPADYATYVLFDSVPDLTTLGSYPLLSEDQGTYTTGSFSRASISTDANGNLAIVYSGINCGSNNNPFDTRWRRDLYWLNSTDNGMTWSDPENFGLTTGQSDLTDGTVGEEAYPATTKRSKDGMLHTLFQYDTYAGSTLNDPFPILEQNKMTVVSIPFPGAVGLNEAISKETFKIFPNPSNGSAIVSFESRNNGNLEINVSNLIGQNVLSLNTEVVKGNNAVSLDLTNNVQGIYLVTIGTGENKLIQKLVIE